MATAGWARQGLPPPRLCAQHWEFVSCEGKAAAVLLGLQEDKSPFMLAVPPQGMEQSCRAQHGARGGHSPRAPQPPGQHFPP